MRFLIALLPLLVPSAEAYRSGDAKRAARAGFAAPEEHEDEHQLAELMSLGVRPGTADDVPPFVLAAAATVRLSAGAMRQLLLRFFLVPSSGYAQATTLLRRINAYLASQWLSISSTAALRNGPYGAIGEWAAKELPKAIVG